MRRADVARVNGLLLEADAGAREILMDVHPRDAFAMVRGWGQVVESAAWLWRALPPDGRGADDTASDLVMQRLEAMAESLQVARSWPHPGRKDKRLLVLADTFDRAGAAMGDGPGRGGSTRAPVAELHGSRARVMHTLYVGGHSVAVAMRGHIHKTEETAAKPANRRNKRDQYVRSLERAHEVLDRVEAFGQLAGSSIARRRISNEGTVPTPRRTTVGPGQRLHEALGAWDIQVHRTLATGPAPQNLFLAARTQAVVTTASAVILGAGARTGHVNRDAYVQRLAPALQASQLAWSQVAGRWGDLVPPVRRPDEELLRAEKHVRTAIREITRGTAGWAPPSVIAERVDIGQTARHLQQALSGAADVAYLVRENTATDRELTGPARAVLARAKADARTIGTTGRSTFDGRSWVSAADVRANRMVRLPTIVRNGLPKAGNDVVRAATAAMSAAACLDAPNSVPQGTVRNPLVTARDAEQRALPTVTTSGHAGPRL